MRKFLKENKTLLIGLLVTAFFITVTAIIFKQAFIRILPLYISLFVSVLQSRINKYSHLLGAANCILYTVVYFHYKLYASIASTLLISLPFQVFTFIRWNTHSWGETTVLKSLSLKQRVAVILGFFVSSFVLWRILSLSDANHVLLDSLGFILGLLNSILTLCAYIEYTWFMLLSTIMNMFLYVSMIFAGNSEQVPYLVFSIYSIVCMCVAFKKANILYKLQQAELKYESQKSN